MSDTFHMTRVILQNGEIRMAGQTVRSNNLGAFSDSVILGFTDLKNGSVYAKLARPHCMATSIGTTCASPALMVETYSVSLDSLMGMALVDAHRRVSMASVIPYDESEVIDLRN